MLTSLLGVDCTTLDNMFLMSVVDDFIDNEFEEMTI